MKILILLFYILLFPSLLFAADSPQKIANNANNFYTQGKYEDALNLYLKAAKISKSDLDTEGAGGCSEGSVWFRMGDMYYDGKGVKQDYKEAFKWYMKAATSLNKENAGGVAGNRALKVAEMYSLGQGVTQDFKQSVYWYLDSIKEGGAFEDFIKVQDDKNERLKILTEEAEKGNSLAEFLLGSFYYKNDHTMQYGIVQKEDSGIETVKGYYSGDSIVNQDYNEAFKWYFKFVSQVEPGKSGVKELTTDKVIIGGYLRQAKKAIAFMYYKGKGVQQDYNEAFKWNSQMQDRFMYDNPPAPELTFMHFYGRGTPVNYTEAYKWFIIANDLEGGDIVSESKMYFSLKDKKNKSDEIISGAMITSKLTHEQIKYAEEEADKWLSNNPMPECGC